MTEERPFEGKRPERPCCNCIFHDVSCHHWDCTPITRNEAESAVRVLRDLAERFEDHTMICVGDIIERGKS